jgi:phage tail sheath protein FI
VSITPTYPGIYIEELPSTSHSITAAPTSVTVFVGYTNPFWVGPGGTPPPWGVATELTSFSDYVSIYGGFFSSPWLPDLVGQAVYQFFLNGGSNAYVVALQGESYLNPSTSPPGSTGVTVSPATATLESSGGDGFVASALQPVGLPASGSTPAIGIPMTISISNITTTTSTDDTADITIVYGTALVETYRRVPIGAFASTINAASRLVSIAPAGSTPLTSYDGLPTQSSLAYASGAAPASGYTVINPLAFGPVFETNSSLDKVAVFNLMALPGMSDSAVLAQAMSFCEEKRAFFIMDPPANAVSDTLAQTAPGAPAGAAPIEAIWEGTATGTPAPPTSQNGAIYFPYLQTTDPISGAALNVPPSGYVAGIFANEDINRGVWKSPAGLETVIQGTTGVVPWGVLTDPQQGLLNPLGINCIRTFPGVGSVVFGARTLVSANSAYQQWKYVAVRRMALFIEQSLAQSLLWAVFEPNATPLWNALSQEVGAFMLGLYRQGAFAGTSASQAFTIQCDSTTTSDADVENGIVNILVGFAPLLPAEFVVIQISQLAGQSSS